MADYENGMIEVRAPEDDEIVARAVWFTDPYTGDWEWEIIRGGSETRRKLDEMYEANRRLERVNFRSVGTKPSFGWVSFEGLAESLRRCLPAYGFVIGEILFPEAITAGAGDSDVREDDIVEGEKGLAEGYEQIRRQSVEWLWNQRGGPPSETDV